MDQSENQAPANDHAPCPNCAQGTAAPRSYIYALGRVEARFPRLSVEKEFAQVTRSSETAGLTDDEVLYKVLSQRQNRYLARQMCWILTIETAGNLSSPTAGPIGFSNFLLKLFPGNLPQLT